MSTNQPPECFGKLWESNAAECAGGYDPGYTSTSGGHVRPKCDFFDSCKVRTQLAKSGSSQSPQIVPSSTLLKNQQVPAQQPPAPTYPAGWGPAAWYSPPPSVQQAPVPGRQAAASQPAPVQTPSMPMPWQGGMMPPWMMMQMMQSSGMPPEFQQLMQMQMMMQMMQVPPPVYPGNFQVHGNIDPIKMMAMNYGMPAYLSVLESRNDGFWGPLGREIFRGMGKALGHSIAHFFDNVALKR